MEMESFGNQLRFWRTFRGVSQMKLAADLNMSSRNLSFLETGRSRPTKPTVIRLTDYLKVPEQEKMRIFTAAGIKYTALNSVYDEESTLLPFRRAVRQLLESHDPYPALVFNECWDLIDMNNTASILMGGLEKGDNVIEKCFLNEAWIDRVTNSDEVLISVFHEMRDDLANNKSDRFISLFRAVERKVQPFIKQAHFAKPAICFDFYSNDIRLSLISMITRFRSPISSTLKGLKVELIFPADIESEAFLISLDGTDIKNIN